MKRRARGIVGDEAEPRPLLSLRYADYTKHCDQPHARLDLRPML